MSTQQTQSTEKTTDRRKVAKTVLVEMAKANNMAAIIALIEERIDKEYYLNQLCKLADPSTFPDMDVDVSEIDASIRILAARKILKLDREEEIEEVSKNDLEDIRKIINAES